MFKALLVVITMMAMGSANASYDNHILSGSVTFFSGQDVRFKVSDTIQVNATYASQVACESAKAAIIANKFDVYAPNTKGVYTKYPTPDLYTPIEKVVHLNCTSVH